MGSRRTAFPPVRHLGSGSASRRAALTTGLVVAGAGLAGACGASSGSTSRAGGSPQSAPSTLAQGTGAAELGTAPASAFELFADEGLNFEALFALGGAGVNSEVGEVITAVNQATAASGGASYQSYFDAMVAMGNALVSKAVQAREAGHQVTARDRFIRAASYYNQALFFVLGTETPGAEREVYETMDGAWRSAAAANAEVVGAPTWTEVSIPWADGEMPGWFMTPRSSSGRRPTVILNNGSDGQNVDLWAWGASAALQRGWNVLVFEGPGQGSMLFVHEVPFRPDWEVVISPIVDFLGRRSEVDRDRIALVGWSEGGELVARAAAKEDRLAALVTDPGAVDVYLAFPEDLRQVAKGTQEEVNRIWAEAIIPGATEAQTFELKKRLEIYSTEALRQARAGDVPTDWYGLSRRIAEFNVLDVAKEISMPVLVTDYEEEQFYPGQAEELMDLLAARPKGSPRAEKVTFTVAEGAQWHDAPMAPQLRNETILDWLEEVVGR